MSDLEYLKSKLRNIADFPKEGIQFKDINSWLDDPKCIEILIHSLNPQLEENDVTKVACIESRGFVTGSILAWILGTPIALVRKDGKLPGKVVKVSYSKEYGEDVLEIQKGVIQPDDVVVIHDDILATGGTALAAWKLVKRFNPKKIVFAFLLELTGEGLEGRKFLEQNTGCDVISVLSID